MTLKDTVNLMTSDDYKDRLRQAVCHAEQMGCRNSGVRSYLPSQSV